LVNGALSVQYLYGIKIGFNYSRYYSLVNDEKTPKKVDCWSPAVRNLTDYHSYVKSDTMYLQMRFEMQEDFFIYHDFDFSLPKITSSSFRFIF